MGIIGVSVRVSRRCVQLVDSTVKSQIPTRQQIEEGSCCAITIEVEPLLQDEAARFEAFLEAKDLDRLVARYPLRHSRLYSAIAESLEFKHKSNYQQALIARVKSDDVLAAKLRERISPVAGALGC